MLELNDAFSGLDFQLPNYIPYMQPFVERKEDGQGYAIVGAEMLARKKTPEGVLTPENFIPELRANGKIVDLDLSMVGHACSYLCTMKHSHPDHILSANLSMEAIMSPHLVERVEGFLNGARIQPEKLKLEILEDAFPDDPYAQAKAIDTIHNLASLGCLIAIDDFGTGSSDFDRIGTLMPLTLSVDGEHIIHTIKIDPIIYKGNQPHKWVIPFLQDHLDHPVTLIFEGVDTEDLAEAADSIIDMSRACEIRILQQGYYHSKPTAAEAYVDRLVTQSEQAYEHIPS